MATLTMLTTRPAPRHSWFGRLPQDGKCDETAEHTAPVASNALLIIGGVRAGYASAVLCHLGNCPGFIRLGGGEGASYADRPARPAAHVVDSAPLPAGAHRQCDPDRAGPVLGSCDHQLGRWGVGNDMRLRIQ